MGTLVACGANSGGARLGPSHGSTDGSYASASATASAATATSSGDGSTGGTGAMPSDTNSVTVNGCPAHQPAAATARPADVVASQSSGLDQQVTLKQGQTLEIRLNPTLRWTLTMGAASRLLTPAQPNGWYGAAVNACVWRFTASASGSADLAFSGLAICQGGSICPHGALAQDYAVTVS
ncbi:MAG TPA: protease inhibitor I42 family protein [Ktedonobacterales bacterium]|nr:protease inhibitor I42 family protein [Ktedonobacterales bacterium]